MTAPANAEDMLYDSANPLDPLGNIATGTAKNRAKVGSARPSSLLYTYGPGALMDLPNFSVMVAGLDDWEPIWARRTAIRNIVEPRLLRVVQIHLGDQVKSLRPFPWQPKVNSFAQEGDDLGVPARVFPQWLRCTGCDLLAPLPRFKYRNTHPFRPDMAQFFHASCPGRGRGGKRKESPAVPAQHLLTCSNGHLDEFPYGAWVHRGAPCSAAQAPALKMIDQNLGKGVGSIIECSSCSQRRRMAEAQGEAGRQRLPQICRGRHPHLNAFDTSCSAQPAIILMGASNLWFPALQSIIVMPRTEAENVEEIAAWLRLEVGADRIAKYRKDLETLRDVADGKVDLSAVSDDALARAVAVVLAPPDSEEQRNDKVANWDPLELLVPEWRYLQKPSAFPQQEDSAGLMVTEMTRSPALVSGITRVVAVNKLKKVNAVLGFTRLDEMDRVNDLVSRLVKLVRNGKPNWLPATEDRGEGIFLQLDLAAVAKWEQAILSTPLWEAHRAAHQRNFVRRFSATAKNVPPDSRLPAPRYWLLHTLSHILIREMAMSCGYGAASLSERIYGWPEVDSRDAAAGLLICTTASDSEGTLGGLVALSEPDRLAGLVESALRRASRCSSDPVCAGRTPQDPEDFLHGAACHCCSFASETSCERANRFLDRRLLLNLPTASGLVVPGYFGVVDAV